jgi:hypothetical protein
MRNRLVIALSVALLGLSTIPANAATKPSAVTAAFKNLLSVTGDSLEQLEQKYESDIDALDATLVAATNAADSTLDQELQAATSLYAPQIAAANKRVEDAKVVFLANNKLTIKQSLFSSMDKDRVWQYFICPDTTLPNGAGWMEIAKRYCANDNNKPRPGDVSTKTTSRNTIGGEDWQPGDLAEISYENSSKPNILDAIAFGWVVPVNLSLYDSSRLTVKSETTKVNDLTLLNGRARTSAQTKRDNAVMSASKTRDQAVADLDEAFETAKARLEAQETAANLALLAAKRAAKDPSNFDKAFAVAYKFEYNLKMVGEIADAAWTGDWTFRTIDSIIKVNRLASVGDGIASRYSFSSANSFNKAVGNAFTNEPDFRAALKVLTSIYKKTTNTTLKFV